MARAKKPARPSASGSETAAPPRPPLPLKFDHARIFALAAAADAEDAERPATPTMPPVVQVDPVAVLMDELRRIRAESVPPTPPTPAVPIREIVEGVRAEIVAVLPELIRDAVAQSAPPPLQPVAPATPAEQARTWIASELKLLAAALHAADPPDYLNDNRKLVERLFLGAAKSGLLFGVALRDFFTLAAGEVREFVFQLAGTSPSAASPAMSENTPAPLETLHTILHAAALPPPPVLRARGFVPTPLLAMRYPHELARFGTMLAKTERQSKTVAAYYRLRVFAGRTDDEIASLLNESQERIAERLGDFYRLLDDDLVAAEH